MKVICKSCGRPTDVLISGHFCSQSCRKIYIRKYRLEYQRMLLKIRRKYKGI